MTSATTTRLADVETRIASAAKSVGRAPTDVTLIAVSKTYDADAILPAIEAGHVTFGENRVQEAQKKWPALKEQFPDLKLHLIGPLQSNKAHDAVALFDAIHTIDRPKIARAIAKEIAAQNRTPELFIQVNTGNEPQKAGIDPKDTPGFLELCKNECGLEISGLMCIPPVYEEPAVHFALLDKLAHENGLKDRSMGMSADFEAAIELGATHIRVGSAIFGVRS